MSLQNQDKGVSELPRSKLRGIKFSKKLSSPLMGED